MLLGAARVGDSGDDRVRAGIGVPRAPGLRGSSAKKSLTCTPRFVVRDGVCGAADGSGGADSPCGLRWAAGCAHVVSGTLFGLALPAAACCRRGRGLPAPSARPLAGGDGCCTSSPTSGSARGQLQAVSLMASLWASGPHATRCVPLPLRCCGCCSAGLQGAVLLLQSPVVPPPLLLLLPLGPASTATSSTHPLHTLETLPSRLLGAAAPATPACC
jgi:hypothetical protein